MRAQKIQMDGFREAGPGPSFSGHFGCELGGSPVVDFRSCAAYFGRAGLLLV
jgi:hypothetical protein